MDYRIIERLNSLWRPIYPYLASWIKRWCPEKEGRVLEIGPFSGGISEAIRGIMRGIEPLCIVEGKEAACMIRKHFDPRIITLVGSYNSLPFKEAFDMVIARGAFFFLSPEMVKEAFRCLRPGASALLGGGYGPLTPIEKIRPIAQESRELNNRLGKRWISKEMLCEMLEEAGLTRFGQIIEDGGLWVLLRR